MTAWHLRGRAGRRQLAVIQAEASLEEYVTKWAADQGLRIFDWRFLAAGRQLWEPSVANLPHARLHA